MISFPDATLPPLPLPGVFTDTPPVTHGLLPPPLPTPPLTPTHTELHDLPGYGRPAGAGVGVGSCQRQAAAGSCQLQLVGPAQLRQSAAGGYRWERPPVQGSAAAPQSGCRWVDQQVGVPENGEVIGHRPGHGSLRAAADGYNSRLAFLGVERSQVGSRVKGHGTWVTYRSSVSTTAYYIHW